MVFASYTRKSIYSDKSDSTKNQAKMCRDYVDFHYAGSVDSFLVYEDEGLTGSNTKRPDLQRLMKDIKSGLIDFLIVYQLDRLSRDIKDFSNIYAFLEEHHVQFISVAENIDTNTPIGKAMMYVSVIFAQMERETIANRVNDNMIGLADDGWWVGGNPPYGWRRTRITSSDGKNHVTIVAEEEEAEFVRSIGRIFLQNNFSLQQLERYFKNHNILTKNGKFFSTNQLHKLLTMPYCAPATQAIYDYYSNLGCIMSSRCPRELWDGTHGVMIYGRTTERNKKHALQPPNKWRVCIGRHKPFMDESTWLSIQNQFTHNVFDKKMKHPIPLLKGVLRCKCGRLMMISRKAKVDGSVSTWYYCPKRMRQGADYCDMSQIKTDIIDDKVIDIFNKISKDPDTINEYLLVSVPVKDFNTEIKDANKSIIKIKNKIQNLTNALAETPDTSAAKYILNTIDGLDKNLKLTERHIADLQSQERKSSQTELEVYEKQIKITDFIRNFENFTPEERNVIARTCIKECVWDGHTLSVVL